MMKLHIDRGISERKARRLNGVPTPELIVQGGEIVVRREPTVLVTILGPCISVCLFDAHRGVGGMSHCLLPIAPGESLPSPRYCVEAHQQLVRGVLAAGAERQHLVAKVFGGARIAVAENAVTDSLGRQNWETALQLLEADRIPVQGKDVGGRFARKVIFRTDDGSAWVKRIESR